MTDNNTKWYCLRVVSNKERKLKERIDLEIDRNEWRGIVPNVIQRKKSNPRACPYARIYFCRSWD